MYFPFLSQHQFLKAYSHFQSAEFVQEDTYSDPRISE